MEDFQEYIESGRLEQYVLGDLSPTEQAEVEGWATRYPQVREELAALETGLGVYAEAHAIAPPAALRDRVLGRVFAQFEQPAQAAPPLAAPVAAVPPMRVSASNPPGAIPPPTTPVAERRRGTSFWAIAASVALVLSLAGNALLYSRWQHTSSELVALQNDQTRVASASQTLQARYDNSQQQLHVLRSPDYRLVALAGTKNAPQARARVLFDKADHRVYLDVQQLPALPAGKQYQLWALNNGKPVDAGLLTAATTTGTGLQQMKAIASAQSFAMTIEPVGGSASPTLSTMTVQGAI